MVGTDLERRVPQAAATATARMSWNNSAGSTWPRWPPLATPEGIWLDIGVLYTSGTKVASAF